MKHLLIICAFAGLAIWLAGPAVAHSPYGYDEADYMFAAKQGFVANYTDRPSMPLPEFLRIGLGRGKDSRQSSALSEMVRGSDDIVFYRHWHGPLYFYWLMLASPLLPDEHAMRLSMLAFPICSLLLIYLGCLWLFPGAHGQLAAALSAALFVWSVTTIRSTELAPHQAFVCCYLAELILLAKTVATGDRRYFYVAAVAAALGCCLLEVGFVMVATLIVCGFVDRRGLRADWAFVARSFVVFAATVLVIWPGAVLKLSFVKGYLFMAYLAIVRKSAWGSESVSEIWRGRVLHSPIEWLLIVVSLLLLVFSHKLKSRRLMYPFAIYAFLMLAATLRVTSGIPRYALPFQPALDLLAGCVLSMYLLKLRPATAYGLTAILCLSLFAATWLDVRRRPLRPDPREPALLAYIRDNHLDHSSLLAPQDDVPALHYYFPNTRLRGYTGTAPDPTRAADAGIDGVIFPDYPIRYQPVLPSR